MKGLLLVGMGGFVGAVLRYLIGGWVQRLVPLSTFPYGTLTVNVLGCFMIGWLTGWVEARDAFDPELRLLVFVGVLGGFTTFSSFGLEAFVLARDGASLQALGTILLHLTLGLGAVWIGYRLG